MSAGAPVGADARVGPAAPGPTGSPGLPDTAGRASAFLDLHRGERILVLPNAWDVASARLFEEAGFAAVGTTSAGIAVSAGYPDGERIPRDEMLRAVQRIAASVSVPVSVDLEAGYGRTPDAVADTVRRAIAAGAAGINLEDGSADGAGALSDVALQLEKLAAAREAARSMRVQIVINARTDVYWLEVGDAAGRFGHAVSRANAYRAAGADCVFIPGVTDASTIAGLVREVDGPLNILAGAATPPVGELERLGVRRLSVGSGPIRAALARVRRIAAELLGPGTYGALTDDTIPYAELNRLVGTA
ncbi:MAG TPA: isocitrate lyase/phosphoenolpyruvate mutase family protein [Longimicrobiales bacterium]